MCQEVHEWCESVRHLCGKESERTSAVCSHHQRQSETNAGAKALNGFRDKTHQNGEHERHRMPGFASLNNERNVTTKVHPPPKGCLSQRDVRKEAEEEEEGMEADGVIQQTVEARKAPTKPPTTRRRTRHHRRAGTCSKPLYEPCQHFFQPVQRSSGEDAGDDGQAHRPHVLGMRHVRHAAPKAVGGW
jgi:hypothetical protein